MKYYYSMVSRSPSADFLNTFPNPPADTSPKQKTTIMAPIVKLNCNMSVHTTALSPPIVV